MSYCRFGDHSDVYVYDNGEFLVCCQCRLRGDHRDVLYPTNRQMLAHLNAHRMVGHKVPERAPERLRKEMPEADEARRRARRARPVHDDYTGQEDT